MYYFNFEVEVVFQFYFMHCVKWLALMANCREHMICPV